MAEAEWLAVLGADGTVIAIADGTPSSWLGTRLAEREEVPAAVRDAARTITANVCSPWRGTTVERVRLAPPASGPVAVELVAIEAVAMRRAEVQLEPLLESTMAPLCRQAEALEIEVVLEQAANVPARVAVDPEKIAWAITALVGNALRYVRRGTRVLPGGTIQVRIGYEDAEGLLVLSVQDDGPGIPAEKLQWLFARPPGSQHAVGLALTVVRDVIAAHGGQMTVESKTTPADHGTTITLRLPAR